MGLMFLAGGVWLSTGAIIGIFVVLVLLVVLLVVAMAIVAKQRSGGAMPVTAGTGNAGGVGNEIAAAIALALALDGGSARAAGAVAGHATRGGSAWNAKSYGMTRMPERRKR